MEKLVAKVKPENATLMKSAVVALYTADGESPLWYANIIGLLTVDFDRFYKNTFLRIYDMETLALSF